MKHGLYLFTQELNEVLIVTVREALGEMKRTYLKKITLFNRIARYGLTMNDGSFSEWETDPRQVEKSTEPFDLRRAEVSKTLSSLCIMRSMNEVNATDMSEDHVRTYRSVFMRFICWTA